MTVQWHTTVRNAIVAAWEASIGVSPTVQLRTGVNDPNIEAAAVGTLVVSFPLAPDWASAPVAGTVSLTGLPAVAAAVADGTIGHYRIMNSAGTICLEQGTVTATGSGGDLTVDNPTVVTGQAVQITSWSKTAPGA